MSKRKNRMARKKLAQKHEDDLPPGHRNPLLKIDESAGESLFAIVDYSLPGDDRVRRVLAKKNADGTITSVVYRGKVGPDRTCSVKTDVREMRGATETKFWKTVRALEAVYHAVGGVVEIRNYAGRTIHEAAELMRRLGNAQVWESKKPERHL